MKNNISALNECYKMFEKLGYHIDRGTLNETPEGDQREFYSNFYGKENQNAQPNNSNHTTDNINNIDSEDDSVLGENLEISVADADGVSYDEGSHTFTIPMLDMRNQDKYVAIVQCPAQGHRSLAYNIYKNDDMTHPVDIEEDSSNDIWIDMYSYLVDWLEEKELIVLTNEDSDEEQYVPTDLINNDSVFTYAKVDAQASNVTYDASNGTFSNIVIFNPQTQQKYLVDVICPDQGGHLNVRLYITTLDGENILHFNDVGVNDKDVDIYVNVYNIVTDFLEDNGYIEYDEKYDEYVPTDTSKQANVIEYDNEIEESIVRSVMKQLIKESKYAKHKI